MKALHATTCACNQGVEKPRGQRSETLWLGLCAGPRKGWKGRVSPVRWFWVTGGWVPEGTSIIFRVLCASSGTTTVLLKPQYLSGAVSQAAHRMGPGLFVGIDLITSVLPEQVRSWRGPSCLCASIAQTQPRH